MVAIVDGMERPGALRPDSFQTSNAPHSNGTIFDAGLSNAGPGVNKHVFAENTAEIAGNIDLFMAYNSTEGVGHGEGSQSIAGIGKELEALKQTLLYL